MFSLLIKIWDRYNTLHYDYLYWQYIPYLEEGAKVIQYNIMSYLVTQDTVTRRAYACLTVSYLFNE